MAELQAAYPSLVIEEGVPTGNASQAVTLTGTSGTANITINGVDYLATFNSDLSTTAGDFVTAHAAAILAATGTVVTANAAVLTFVDAATGFPTISIANATGDLAGTVAAIDYLTNAAVGGCQRVYSTYVTTSLVCEECDDIYLQPFMSEEPKPFDNVAWNKVEVAYDEDALMGIRFTGKAFDLLPTEATRDEIPFYETSTRIKSISGGYREMDYLNIVPAYTYDELFKIKRLSRAVDRDALGAMLFPVEEISRTHYTGEKREFGNLFAKANLSEESVLKFDSQYISYDITWHDTKLSQGMGGRSNITHTEQVWVEFGKHDNIQAVINALAAKAGVEITDPTAN